MAAAPVTGACTPILMVLSVTPVVSPAPLSPSRRRRRRCRDRRRRRPCRRCRRRHRRCRCPGAAGARAAGARRRPAAVRGASTATGRPAASTGTTWPVAGSTTVPAVPSRQGRRPGRRSRHRPSGRRRPGSGSGERRTTPAATAGGQRAARSSRGFPSRQPAHAGRPHPVESAAHAATSAADGGLSGRTHREHHEVGEQQGGHGEQRLGADLVVPGEHRRGHRRDGWPPGLRSAAPRSRSAGPSRREAPRAGRRGSHRRRRRARRRRRRSHHHHRSDRSPAPAVTHGRRTRRPRSAPGSWRPARHRPPCRRRPGTWSRPAREDPVAAGSVGGVLTSTTAGANSRSPASHWLASGVRSKVQTPVVVAGPGDGARRAVVGRPGGPGAVVDPDPVRLGHGAGGDGAGGRVGVGGRVGRLLQGQRHACRPRSPRLPRARTPVP